MTRFARAGFLALLLAAAPASGQTNAGTAIGQFSLIEPSARIAGMGNAGVSFYEGIQAIYYNAAALGPVEHPEVQLTHSVWFADITYDYAAVAVPVRGIGNFLASLTALNSGDIDVRTVLEPLGTGQRYSVSDVALGLAYARRLTDRFSAGAQANYLTETIWHSTSSTLTFNLGTLYRLSPDGLRIGASLTNFGTKARFSGDDLAIQFDQDPETHGDNSVLPANQFTGDFPVPVLFRVGVSMPRRTGADGRLLVALDAAHPSNNTESVSGGAEWSWRETLALRAGYQNLFQTDSEVGPTLGVGFEAGPERRRMHLDYAWAVHDRLPDTHRVTFVLTF
jgi:hypothetical protein